MRGRGYPGARKTTVVPKEVGSILEDFKIQLLRAKPKLNHPVINSDDLLELEKELTRITAEIKQLVLTKAEEEKIKSEVDALILELNAKIESLKEIKPSSISFTRLGNPLPITLANVSIPYEVLVEILSYLQSKDISKFLSTCKSLNAAKNAIIIKNNFICLGKNLINLKYYKDLLGINISLTTYMKMIKLCNKSVINNDTKIHKLHLLLLNQGVSKKSLHAEVSLDNCFTALKEIAWYEFWDKSGICFTRDFQFEKSLPIGIDRLRKCNDLSAMVEIVNERLAQGDALNRKAETIFFYQFILEFNCKIAHKEINNRFECEKILTEFKEKLFLLADKSYKQAKTPLINRNKAIQAANDFWHDFTRTCLTPGEEKILQEILMHPLWQSQGQFLRYLGTPKGIDAMKNKIGNGKAEVGHTTTFKALLTCIQSSVGSSLGLRSQMTDTFYTLLQSLASASPQERINKLNEFKNAHLETENKLMISQRINL